MKIYSVKEKEFNPYGKVVDGDFKELLAVLHTKDCPTDRVIYVPSDKDLEQVEVAKALRIDVFGGLPIQIGYCNGHNHLLNCLEYHKNSEINIAESDTILLLGKVQDMDGEKYDTKNVMAFLVPAGCAVELYATTLHYAPCGDAFRVVVVLPQGTNYEKPEGATDRLLWASNKWLIAHAQSDEAKQGAFVGLMGENIRI
jgi:hypothetical protein